VTVHRATAPKVGTAQTVRFMGDNPVIDRRAISFVASGPKKDKDKAAAGAPAGDAKPAAAEGDKTTQPRRRSARRPGGQDSHSRCDAGGSFPERRDVPGSAAAGFWPRVGGRFGGGGWGRLSPSAAAGFASPAGAPAAALSLSFLGPEATKEIALRSMTGLSPIEAHRLRGTDLGCRRPVDGHEYSPAEKLCARVTVKSKPRPVVHFSARSEKSTSTLSFRGVCPTSGIVRFAVYRRARRRGSSRRWPSR